MPFAVVALTDATLLHIDRALLLEFAAADPAFLMRLIAALSERVLGLIHDIAAFTLQTPVQRVAGYLADLSGATPEGAAVTLPAARKVVAARLGMTPEAFSRVLRDLADADAIDVSADRIAIKHPQRLRDYAAL